MATELARKPLIFVSHSSRDKLVADAICARLESAGLRCWIAPRDVNPGRDYSDQIAAALERATAMVLVFSSGSNQSRHVKSEIDRAFSLGHVIVPFRVENVLPEKGLAYYLSKTHWLDAVNPPMERHIDLLEATLRKLQSEDLPQGAPAFDAPVVAPLPGAAPWARSVGGIALGLLVLALGAGIYFFQTRELAVKAAAPAPLPEPSPAQSPSPLAGTWTIAEGRTPAGAAYTGSVRFTPQRDRYQVTWQTGTESYSGIGLARGDKLCAAWSKEPFGVVFYQIGKDGTLEGPWTASGAGGNQSDGMERASGGVPGTLEGSYRLTGQNLGAPNIYSGELIITRTGDVYQLQWKVGSGVINGIGFRIEDDFFVAWGGNSLGVVGYLFAGDRARGVWTHAGASATGSENLAR